MSLNAPPSSKWPLFLMTSRWFVVKAMKRVKTSRVFGFCFLSAGASQVKWNRKNQYLLASSHDGDVRIWDKRVSRLLFNQWICFMNFLVLWSFPERVFVFLSEQKPNTAVEYVAAHLSKIHGLDWHPDNEFILATSSQDNSVRVRTSNTPLILLLLLSGY